MAEIFQLPVQAPKKPAPGKAFRFKGKVYALSTYAGDLMEGLTDDSGSPDGGAKLIELPVRNPWKYLWVYDTDKKMVVMWRVTDGNEKAGGSASYYQKEILRLERLGQLNRVTNQEYRALEAEMRRRERSVMRSLSQSIEMNKTEYDRFVDKVAWEIYHRDIEPAVLKRVAEVLRGVHPFGFTVNENIARFESPMQQAIGFVMAQEFSRFTPDLVEEEIRKRGEDPQAPGRDWQAAEWATHDVYYEAYKDLKTKALRKIKKLGAEQHTYTFTVGEPILYGKWKNKRGFIKSFGHDAKGNPVILVEPVPKGRKKDKVLQLFRVWKDVPATVIASRYLTAGMFEPPPRLVAAFLKWAYKAYAEHVMYHAESRIETLRGRAKMLTRAAEEMKNSLRNLERDLDALKPGEDLKITVYRYYNDALQPMLIGARRAHIAGLKGEPRFFYGEGQQRISFSGSDLTGLERTMDKIQYKLEYRIKSMEADAEIMAQPGQDESSNLVEAVRLLNATKQYAPKAKLHKVGVKSEIKVTPALLQGWKYWDVIQRGMEKQLGEKASVETDFIAFLEKKTWDTVYVSLSFAGHASRGGVWKPGSWILEADVPNQGKVKTVKQFEEGLAWIALVARHEFQHFAQDFLQLINSWKAEAGLPSPHLRDSERDSMGYPKGMHPANPLKEILRSEHALQDVEFYTDLQDEVDEFLKKLPSIEKSLWRATLRRWVELDKPTLGTSRPYFRNLKRSAPAKWQRAVSEFFKEVNKHVEIPAR